MSDEPLKVIAANVGCRVRRASIARSAISETITSNNPDIALLQDCLSAKQWNVPGYTLLDEDNQETTSTIFYKNGSQCVSIDIPQNIMQKIQGVYPGDKIQQKIGIAQFSKNDIQLIVVSWHGSDSDEKHITYCQKKTFFQHFLKFLDEIRAHFSKPLLVGGDFSLAIDEARSYVSHPLYIYDYTPTERRKGSVTDYFISSGEIVLTKPHPVELAERILPVIAHDPIMCTVNSMGAFPEGGFKINKASWKNFVDAVGRQYNRKTAVCISRLLRSILLDEGSVQYQSAQASAIPDRDQRWQEIEDQGQAVGDRDLEQAQEVDSERGPALDNDPERGPALIDYPERGPALDDAFELGPALVDHLERGPALLDDPELGPALICESEQRPALVEDPERV